MIIQIVDSHPTLHGQTIKVVDTYRNNSMVKLLQFEHGAVDSVTASRARRNLKLFIKAW